MTKRPRCIRRTVPRATALNSYAPCRQLARRLPGLRELDQLKSDFISNITHDLKTPLASITEANQLLLEGVAGTISPDQKHLLRIIKEDAARLIRLIESMIDLSKMESGLQQYAFVLSDIAPVIAEAVEAMQLLAESKQIKLSFTAAPDLPKLLLDRDKMGQALINLLSNAIKFTPAGGTVTISLSRTETHPADFPAGPAALVGAWASTRPALTGGRREPC